MSRGNVFDFATPRAFPCRLNILVFDLVFVNHPNLALFPFFCPIGICWVARRPRGLLPNIGETILSLCWLVARPHLGTIRIARFILWPLTHRGYVCVVGSFVGDPPLLPFSFCVFFLVPSSFCVCSVFFSFSLLSRVCLSPFVVFFLFFFLEKK